MASAHRSRVDPDTTAQDAANLGSSWALPPPSRSITSRAATSETASLNSLRRRASLFGRSSSDAGSMRRAAATSHTAKSSLSSLRIGEEAVRPTTSSGESRRRKTDPLQSIRDSIFGGKKKASGDAADTPISRPGSSGASQAHNANGFFDSEEDYYRHLKKHSISPPFNFQHVTHTARSQLSHLETVDEKDLSAEFWSVAAYQRPRRKVHGIKVDNLKDRQMGLIRESEEAPPALSPPTSPQQMATSQQIPINDMGIISPISPVSPLDSSITASDPRESHSAERTNSHASSVASDTSASRVANHPKRQSSLGTLNLQSRAAMQPAAASGPATHLGSQASFYNTRSSFSEGDLKTDQQEGEQKPPKRSVPELNASMPPSFAHDHDVAFRSRQPLPSLPSHPTASSSSPNLIQTHPTPPKSMLSPTLPPIKPASPKSKRSSKSSKSSRSARKSSAVSQTSADFRLNNSFSVSDVSWEDSIDLAYEEEAEATCDFAWDEDKQARLSATEKRNSAATVYQAESPDISNVGGSAFSEHRNSSSDTVAGGEGPHRRGTSVGHRGFLAARKNSSTSDLLTKAKEAPAPLTFSQNSTQVSVLSPVFSVAEDDTTKSPFTPAELHYPRIERVSNDYLSDPESCRNSHSSKHRKSSSYGSYGSYESVGTRAGPSNSTGNPTRWSIASSGSVPELMHSRPKSKSSLSRSMVSQPLDPLPQSPPDSGTEAEFREDIPRSQPAAPESAAVLRRSVDSTDRVMQAAGRAVQRGRPGSYARYSQHLEPQAPPRGGVRESWVAGPEWI